ncbi:hypothetical protein [Rhizobium mayense]|uniref:AbiTii domain-containing protein n=1 Tax=Rhizobium mayense TaxID=1312184 RepID=UPI00398C2CC4
MLKYIIESLTDGKQPIANELRRTLVLSYRIKHEPLRKWVEQELNGYADDAELPDYRSGFGTSKGLFIGPGGSQLQDQPLAAGVLKPDHRHWAREIKLRQPIASYDLKDIDDTGKWVIEWPADLVTHYQTKFIRDWVLNRAHLEIPISMIVGLVDTVRTRLLTFALEIEAAAPMEGDKALAQIPPATVDRIMNVTILGGNNVIGSVNEFKAATVVTGNLKSLHDALRELGVDQAELETLEGALKDDGIADVDENKPKTIGQRTLEWIGKAAKATGKKGLEVGGAVMEEAIKRAVSGYLGF